MGTVRRKKRDSLLANKSIKLRQDACATRYSGAGRAHAPRVLRQREWQVRRRDSYDNQVNDAQKFRQETLLFALRVIGIFWRFVMTGRYDSAFLKHKKLTKPLILLVKIR